MLVFSATEIQISGTSTPSKSSTTIDCFTAPIFSGNFPAVESIPAHAAQNKRGATEDRGCDGSFNHFLFRLRG
jgi:hypothetical protein